MGFKIGDQVVRAMVGNGLEVWQVVAVKKRFMQPSSYIVGTVDKDYYILCQNSELFACPDTMKLPDKKLLISLH